MVDVTLQTMDYVLLGLAAALAITGLFRGLSGTLAFLIASIAGLGVVTFGWPLSAEYWSAVWMRAGAILIATLLVFGLVRFVVQRTIHVLLAQPADAIFGFVSGALVGALVVVAWAYSSYTAECSTLVLIVRECLFV